MLVYSNYLSFQGADAEESIFKAIGVWTKEQLGFGLHPNQLRNNGEFDGSRNGSPSWLKINVTIEEDPQLYAWVLKVVDSDVRGRQWITELGLRIEDGEFAFSCVLRTDEHSTMVAEPVAASQPRVIRYLIENIKNSADAKYLGSVPGTTVRKIGEGVDSYRALLDDIERKEREYPIVLVSPNQDESYLLNRRHLQEVLVGLAQVVEVLPAFDSYEMEEILGRHWSAWDGAVNIIHMPSKNGFVRGRVIGSDEIESWGETQHERMSHMLAWVTNNTNITRLRKRIRSEGVAQLALRRRVQLSRARSSAMDDSQLRQELEHVWQLADEQSLQVNELEEQISLLEGELEMSELSVQESSDDLRAKDFKIESLKHQLRQASHGQAPTFNVEGLLDVATRSDEPAPLECLNLISDLFDDKCIILESARDSAKNMNRFMYGRRLLKNLHLLVTNYRDKLIEGGDSIARTVFGRNEYAATESETVTSNPEMRKMRTFEYNGQKIEMFRHLKLGVEDSATKTIRVHFFWDSDNKKIVIGYCGEHLPIASH
jgi:hypothetical protein